MSKQNNEPLVSIVCNAYNHEKFINDAIDGFLLQKTSFPVEILIHDDASTDRTPEIIRSYANKHPSLIFPLYQRENQFSLSRKPTSHFQIPRARGKYIIICEGDDYWTAPDKLQRQVEFLENNPEYSGCFHETQQIFYPENTVGKVYGRDAPKEVTTADTLSALALFHTSSLVFRKEAFIIPDWFDKIVSGDMAIFSIISSYGPIGKIDGVMSVYRKHDGGLTGQKSLHDDYHSKRIELLQNLNEFHQYKFSSKANEIIRFHQRTLAESEKSNFSKKQGYLQRILSKLQRAYHRWSSAE